MNRRQRRLRKRRDSAGIRVLKAGLVLCVFGPIIGAFILATPYNDRLKREECDRIWGEKT